MRQRGLHLLALGPGMIPTKAEFLEWPKEYQELYMGFNNASAGMWQQNMPEEWIAYVEEFRSGLADRIRVEIAH